MEMEEKVNGAFSFFLIFNCFWTVVSIFEGKASLSEAIRGHKMADYFTSLHLSHTLFLWFLLCIFSMAERIFQANKTFSCLL